MTARLTPGTSGSIEEQHEGCRSTVAVLSFTMMSNHSTSGGSALEIYKSLLSKAAFALPQCGLNTSCT